MESSRGNRRIGEEQRKQGNGEQQRELKECVSKGKRGNR
jgi:hypothetical protein